MTPSAPRFAPPPRLLRAQRGAAGDWLDGLPELVTDLLLRWRLTAERVVAPGGRTSMIVLVRTTEGAPAALKLCAPGSSAASEHAALERWGGLGAVRSLRCDPQAGALLLERLHGEVALRSLPEAKATLEALSVIRRLWVEPGTDHPFPTVAERTGAQAESMRAAAPPAVRQLVDEALRLRAALCGSAAPAERFLLHGDFRQGAVLAADTDRARWLAVGPEPLVGERAYDLSRLVRDRLHDLVASAGAAAQTRRRVTKLAGAVELDSDRVRDWALFRAVESGVRHLAAGDREDGEALLEFATWL
ncbi:aminoglycoside phosphotransferase family protein [Streptomyces sp. ACA25]|uniref:aminoglycoside phosphotransferase family protein n=1 Tax=Streptomyces sp. ACA25 TaxID=3022596 RepID=UPI00230804F0|nr:aminoglycoside phosphotransferase family protein [Streptomyces sp. ACA25]MDB1089704.1 aminoglycoside phosphotransferase family protein [Streptomyces sp. ACA25]